MSKKKRKPLFILLAIIFFPITIIVLLIKLIIKLTKKDEPEAVKEPIYRTYQLKNCLLTNCEMEYYNAIKSILPAGYILQPQVNLASIIEKVSEERFQNELYRNIDFCIFDLKFKPIVLIEINDKTHSTDKSRQSRDIKVKEICEAASIPIITFWTSYGINMDYIKKRIMESLK